MMGYSTGSDVGTGLAITWNSTALEMEVLGLSADGESVPIIDGSHMGSSTCRTKYPGDLRDEGSFDVEMHLSPPKMATMRAGSTGSVVVTVPWGAGSTSITGGAIVESRNYTIPFEDKMLCGFTLVWATEVVMPAT